MLYAEVSTIRLRSHGNGTKIRTEMQMFSFPVNPELRGKWIAAIHRSSFAPTKYTKVSFFQLSPTFVRI